jgi:hypothetical protein
MSIIPFNNFPVTSIEQKRDKALYEKKCADTPLGTLFKDTVFTPTDKKIKPFDLTQVNEQIAEKTRDAVSGVLGFNGYGLKNPTLGNQLDADIKALDSEKKTIKDDADKSMFVLLRGFITSIKKAIEKPVKQFSIDDVHSLRTNVRSALNLMKNNEALFKKYEGFAQFLEALSYQITTQVEGMSILESMGEQALAWCIDNPSTGDGDVSIATIANHVEEAFYRMPADDWDTIPRWFKWVKSNPQETLFAQLDNHIPGCDVLYNSHNQGNVNVFYGQCIVGKLGDEGYKKIRMYIGAGAMNDPVISEASMRWGTRKGEIHVAHTLEYPDKKGEKARLEKLRDLINRINDSFKNLHKDLKRLAVYLVGTTHDGKIENGKGEFSKIKNVDDFHTKLYEIGLKRQRKIGNIKTYEGFALPRPLLSNKDIEDALKHSQEALEAALGTDELNPYSKAEYNQRLCSAMLANFNAFLDVKILINLGNMRANGEISEATYNMVCKQCFDRGPLANAILLTYVKLIEKDDLDANDEKQILGILMRTMMGGGDRKMVKNRRQTFIDLFKIVGKKQLGLVKQLRTFAKGNDGAWIKFVPSNMKFVPSNPKDSVESSSEPEYTGEIGYTSDPGYSSEEDGYTGETEDSILA